MRTPIACVRGETAYDRTPYTPIDASASAIAPKIENIHPNNRYCQNVLRRASSPVCTLKMGSVGSDLRISCRTALVIPAGDPPATRIVRPVLRVGSYG